jgi:RNA polymerase sigma-70 factor (ECF subfamily)
VDLDEVSQAVFAEEAGLSPSGARTRVQRARRLLLASLQACCPVRFEEGEVVDTGVAGCTNCG